MWRRGAATSHCEFHWCLMWLLAAVGVSADNKSIAAVGEETRFVALGQAVTFQCRFRPASGLEVEYGWKYRNLCSNSGWTKFVVHGKLVNSGLGSDLSFTPAISDVGKELAGFSTAGDTTLTIHNTSNLLNASEVGLCPKIGFSCFIVDRHDSESTAEIQLNLYDPARVRGSTFEQLHYDESSNVTLPCEAAGIPTPAIRWTKNAGSDGRPKTLPGTGGFEYSGPLPSFAATAASAGNYTCFVYNDFGNASKTVELNVRSKPIVETLSPRRPQAAGFYVSLVCFAESTEPLTAIWWLHDGSTVAASTPAQDGADSLWSDPAVNTSDHHRIIMKKPKVAGSRYTSELLVGVSRSDYHRVYTCYFNNSIGVSSADVQIVASHKALSTFSEGQKAYRGEASSSAIVRASILLLLLGFLLHDLF